LTTLGAGRNHRPVTAGSIVLAFLALGCVGLGVLTTPIPIVGAVFSFVVGGLALSRAKREGRPGDGAIAGIVMSALALIPALLVALTCGVCNALFTAEGVGARRDFGVRFGSGLPLRAPDAGVSSSSAAPSPAAPSRARAPKAPDMPPPALDAPPSSADRLAPPPAFPPPPIPPKEP
jgi:hypothetical protein